MSKQHKNNMKKFANSKVSTTRTNRNKRKYVTVNKKKSYSPLFLFIFFLSILGNVFLIGHYITFDHNKVKIETKEVIKPSPNYLFLGDSITYYYDLEEFFPDEPVINSGIMGNITGDILNDMEKRVYQFNPSKVFLLIGTNDLDRGREVEDIVTDIKRIVDAIKANRPQAEIYIESIYPINQNVEDTKAANRDNEDIQAINESLQTYCQEEKIEYIDLYGDLADEDGNLKEEYTEDGLHISEAGYEVITDKIKPYLEEE